MMRVETITETTADIDNANAYLVNALFELDALESHVHDFLTGSNDWFVKETFLEMVGAIRTNLRSAL